VFEGAGVIYMYAYSAEISEMELLAAQKNAREEEDFQTRKKRQEKYSLAGRSLSEKVLPFDVGSV
jgi:hypothetical protein